MDKLSCDNDQLSLPRSLIHRTSLEVVHRLGVQGEDYRDMLEQGLHTTTSESLQFSVHISFPKNHD